MRIERRRVLGLLAVAAGLLLGPATPARADFFGGAPACPLGGCTFRGPITAPSLTLSGAGTALTVTNGASVGTLLVNTNNAPGAAGIAAPGTNALTLGNGTTGTSLEVLQQTGDLGTNANWIYVEGSNAGSHFAKISAEGTETYGNLVVDCYHTTGNTCQTIFNMGADGTQFVIADTANSVASWQASGAPAGSTPALVANAATGGSILSLGTAALYFGNTSYGDFMQMSGSGATMGLLTLLTANNSITLTGAAVGGGASSIFINTALETVIGSGSAITTGATGGFFHLPFTTAAPTGTPAGIYGNACEINTATETLNCYIGSSWYHVTLTAGAG